MLAWWNCSESFLFDGKDDGHYNIADSYSNSHLFIFCNQGSSVFIITCSKQQQLMIPRQYLVFCTVTLQLFVSFLELIPNMKLSIRMCSWEIFDWRIVFHYVLFRPNVVLFCSQCMQSIIHVPSPEGWNERPVNEMQQVSIASLVPSPFLFIRFAHVQ